MESTSSEASHRYARHDDVVTREILGETLLVPISSRVADMSNIFALNDTGAWIWQRLDGDTTLSAIRDALTEEFQVTAQEAWHDVVALVQELAGAGLARRIE